MKFKITLNKNNTKVFLILFLIFILFIYYYFGFHKIKNYVVEVFTNLTNDNVWSEDLKKRFLIYQNSMSKYNHNYDLQVLQQQVTSQEVEEYLKTGYWNWDKTLKELYLDKVNSSTLVNTNPQISLNYAMKMYTPKAIEQLLAWNYKEGEFLLYGAEDMSGNIVKCSPDDEPFLTSDGKNKIWKYNNENCLDKENEILKIVAEIINFNKEKTYIISVSNKKFVSDYNNALVSYKELIQQTPELNMLENIFTNQSIGQLTLITKIRRFSEIIVDYKSFSFVIK